VQLHYFNNFYDTSNKKRRNRGPRSLDILSIRESRASSSGCAGQYYSRNRVYDTSSIPNESLSEKMRSSTSGVSCPRTKNAFQLLKSFKRETMPKREKRSLFLALVGDTTGKRFSTASSPPRPFPSFRTADQARCDFIRLFSPERFSNVSRRLSRLLLTSVCQ